MLQNEFVIGEKMNLYDKCAVLDAWKQGLFGNAPRVWLDKKAALQSDCNRFSVRYHAIRARKTAVGLSRQALSEFDESFYSISESMPDDELLVQGELCLAPGYQLTASFQPGLAMRQAMASGFETITGLRAKLLLQEMCSDASFNELIEMLEYDAIIEFSTYSRSVGCLPLRNTIIWEVRRY